MNIDIKHSSMIDNLRTQAQKLRKMGLSYSQIMAKIPVAKSTLSYWMRTVPLNDEQRLDLKRRQRASALKGAHRRREIRELRTKDLDTQGLLDVGRLTQRELWLVGIALYWGEGNKQKTHNVSQRTIFSNSDPSMIRIYLAWLKLCGIQNSRIHFELYLHMSNNSSQALEYWRKEVRIPREAAVPVRWKKNILTTRRKNIGAEYYGLLRVVISKSTDFNRQIAGWIKAIGSYSGVV